MESVRLSIPDVRPISKNYSKNSENVVLGFGIPSEKHTEEMKNADNSKTPSRDANNGGPLTPSKANEAAKPLGPNASPMTPWTAGSAQTRRPHAEMECSANIVEKSCSSKTLELAIPDTFSFGGEGFIFAPNKSGKTIETSGAIPCDTSIGPSNARNGRDLRSQSVRSLSFDECVDADLVLISGNAGQNGPEVSRDTLIIPSESEPRSNLFGVLHCKEQSRPKTEGHCTNGSVDDDRVSISKVSRGKNCGERHCANGSVDEDRVSVSKVSRGKFCGERHCANGSVDEDRVSISDVLREEAFVEATRVSFVQAIVSKQYEDAGLSPSNGKVEDDSSSGSEQSVPTTPTTPSNQFINVPDTCPRAPTRDGPRSRISGSGFSSVCRKLEF